MAFQTQAPDGSTQHSMVTKVKGDAGTIDINHPLAGIALNFYIQILSVRVATEEALAPLARFIYRKVDREVVPLH